jgi:uncharacterized membrane protein YraQ (UPF0718 family)
MNMEEAVVYVKNLFLKTMEALGTSLQHNWKVLLFAIVLAVVLKTYVNSDKLSKLLFRRKKISIFASVLFGAFTPLCACGTTAVLIGMLTTTLPWSPIMAFLTSSPLMSPDGFFLISGVIGLKFAIALTVASIVIGISSGFITNYIEKKTEFFKDQSRFSGSDKTKKCACSQEKADKQECVCSQEKADKQECVCGQEIIDQQGCACSQEIIDKQGCACSLEVTTEGCSCNSAVQKSLYSFDESLISKIQRKLKLKIFMQEFVQLGLKQILLFYSIFICIGYLINYFIPASIISVLFGADSFYAVPLASIIGLPLYITTDSGIPIIQSMIQSGASQGAMLAFMITGSATSAWVIAGLTSFMKKRAIMLYVSYVLVGGIIAGYVLDFINLFV